MDSEHISGTCNVGMIGLAVMGQNLALNMADHGYRVAVYNRTNAITDQFAAEQRAAPMPLGGAIVPTHSLGDFLKALSTPRIIVMLVKAGPPVDMVLDALIEAGIEPDDVVVDGGNSLWTDTIRREKEMRSKLRFFGSGVSGGELGARFGPSLMPGGDRAAWNILRPIWEAIAARVDPQTGKPIETYAPGQPITHGEPCTAYIGPDGAGHYVKMVHNGIEYADMQLICEAYHLLRTVLELEPRAIGDIFAEWNTGDLDSYLIEITADILHQDDPQTGRPFVDVVLDAAAQKGTGRWTAENALQLGIPAMSIAEAVFMRSMSALKDERVAAAGILRGPDAAVAGDALSGADKAAFIAAVRDALYCSKICAYAQGFQLMAAAQQEYSWSLDFASIARIWRGGCIIRARFLQRITEAYERDAALPNLLLDAHFAHQLQQMQQHWRAVVSRGIMRGVPCAGFSSSLAYYDSYRSATLPANLLQAQRDYFGAHSYERTDQPRGTMFHLDWPSQPRSEQRIDPNAAP